jgi:hypothetical protein
VHDVGVMLTGEDIAGAAHVRGQLIHLVEATIDDAATELGVAQVTDHEIIGLRLGVGVVFEIDAADPEAFALQRFTRWPPMKPPAPR